MGRLRIEVKVDCLYDVQRFIELCDLIEISDGEKVTASNGELAVTTALSLITLPGDHAEDDDDTESE